MSHLRPSLAICSALTLVLLAGCLGEGHGLRVGPDGRLQPQTAEVVAQDTSDHIATSLMQQLGRGWQVTVDLAPKPEWEAAEADEYGWRTLTATITCHGQGTPGVDQATIATEVREYLRGKVARPRNENLTVEVRFAAPQPGVPAAMAPLAAGSVSSATSGPRTYTVQPGDTLADISTVFFGGPEAWRRIVVANPGLDPAHLAPGTVLTIPPR